MSFLTAHRLATTVATPPPTGMLPISATVVGSWLNSNHCQTRTRALNPGSKFLAGKTTTDNSTAAFPPPPPLSGGERNKDPISIKCVQQQQQQKKQLNSANYSDSQPDLFAVLTDLNHFTAHMCLLRVGVSLTVVKNNKQSTLRQAWERVVPVFIHAFFYLAKSANCPTFVIPSSSSSLCWGLASSIDFCTRLEGEKFALLFFLLGKTNYLSRVIKISVLVEFLHVLFKRRFTPVSIDE